MTKLSGTKKWHVIVPVVDNNWTGPGRVTEYRIAKTINAPTFEDAIEEAKPVAEPYMKKYFEDSGDIMPVDADLRTYKLRGSSLWRVQPERVYSGTKLAKYV